ncbi:hypothetical protein ElyMa_000745200 [Elysia marginata]|uniref:Uncharacterized protein n=1 Tax=Elysia marginata TaxID=1093978 RepID=A0AAV4GS83_9GAST|nr:hypothetical protein ElyMa_000745200 [Elysia marginata]
MLNQRNRYISELRCAYEFARNCSYVIVTCENATARPSGEHGRRYNAPTSNDIAVMMPNDPVGHKDIVLHTRSNECRCIGELYKAYDPVRYPLQFPFGTDGWSF